MQDSTNPRMRKITTKELEELETDLNARLRKVRTYRAAFTDLGVQMIEIDGAQKIKKISDELDVFLTNLLTGFKKTQRSGR